MRVTSDKVNRQPMGNNGSSSAIVRCIGTASEQFTNHMRRPLGTVAPLSAPVEK
jgi:hypothetical protein